MFNQLRITDEFAIRSISRSRDREHLHQHQHPSLQARHDRHP